MTRQDLDVDPVMDFLVNLKQGHCERYATALALMLRSLGVPARVVKGFRGADDQGDGVYVIRHSHATPGRDPGTARRFAPPRVRLADAGPDAGRIGADAEHVLAVALVAREAAELHQWWQTLIVDYNADEQADLWDIVRPGRRLFAARKIGSLLLTGLTALLGLVLLRRLLRRGWPSGGRAADVEAFYGRLLALLARHAALRPQSGQTPREFAKKARQLFEGRPGWTALADLPDLVIELYYRVRFGGRPLTETGEPDDRRGTGSPGRGVALLNRSPPQGFG